MYDGGSLSVAQPLNDDQRGNADEPADADDRAQEQAEFTHFASPRQRCALP